MKKHFEVGTRYPTQDFMGFDRYMVKNTRAYVYYRAENGNYKLIANSKMNGWEVSYMTKNGVPMQVVDIQLKGKKDLCDKIIDMMEDIGKGYN